MRKLAFVFLLLILTFSLSACVFGGKGAALQVNSTPKAAVFINNKQVGLTPFVEEKLAAGEVSLKLVPETTAVSLLPWEGKVKLTAGAMAVVNREFGQTEGAATGETLTLEKAKDKENAALAVISSPDSAVVKLDGEAKGFTPLALEKVTPGDREILVSATGYSDRTIKAKLAAGYKLTLSVKLAQKQEEPTPTPTPTPPGGKAARVTPKPSPTGAKPTGPPATPPARPYVEIKETPTGWLRVRSEASTTATELAKVYPGERYALLDEESGWYKIKSGDKEGWISGRYAEKYE